MKRSCPWAMAAGSEPSNGDRLIQKGVEKVVVNALTVEDPDEVRRMSDYLGSSTIVAGIDAVETAPGRHEVVTRCGTVRTGIDVRSHAEAVAAMGAGELFLNAVHRDGTMDGYDIGLLRSVSEAVGIPVVACGGAGSMAISPPRSRRAGHRPRRQGVCSSSTGAIEPCSSHTPLTRSGPRCSGDRWSPMDARLRPRSTEPGSVREVVPR